MSWYNYVACFLAGAFLANVSPHFFHGISGDRLRSPNHSDADCRRWLENLPTQKGNFGA